jgi:hypothetical protein
MAFDPEQFELLNDYGIILSERTRRLIKRNNMKLELEQKEKEKKKEREKGNIIYNILMNVLDIFKESIMTLVGVIFMIFGFVVWIASLLIWMLMVILVRVIEMTAVGIIFYIVSEYIKKNGQLPFQVR